MKSSYSLHPHNDLLEHQSLHSPFFRYCFSIFEGGHEQLMEELLKCNAITFEWKKKRKNKIFKKKSERAEV